MPSRNLRLAIFVGALATATALAAQWKTHWSYAGADGPEHWASLDPAYSACGGKEQSPVDIQGALPASLPPLHFENHIGPVNIENNGYTAIRVDYAPGNGNLLIVGDRHYELVQFHFHHPSEEWIDGKPFPMNLHLMYQDAGGHQAGVSVMLRVGRGNIVMHELWQNMPEAPAKPALVAGLRVNPEALLPADRSYYTYVGSGTAPPCTEGMTWYVLRQPADISASDVGAFARLYPADVRPLQPLNGRVIQASR